MILDDSTWGEDDRSEEIEAVDRIEAGIQLDNWNVPDMGFMQREYTESELGDVVDFDRLSLMEEQEEEIESVNPFIEFEAQEVSDEDEETEEVRGRRKRPHFVIDSD